MRPLQCSEQVLKRIDTPWRTHDMRVNSMQRRTQQCMKQAHACIYLCVGLVQKLVLFFLFFSFFSIICQNFKFIFLSMTVMSKRAYHGLSILSQLWNTLSGHVLFTVDLFSTVTFGIIMSIMNTSNGIDASYCQFICSCWE